MLKYWEPTTQMIAPHAQIEYVLGGVDHRRESVDVTEVAFERVNRVRTPKSWKHKRNYTGQYWAATTLCSCGSSTATSSSRSVACATSSLSLIHI